MELNYKTLLISAIALTAITGVSYAVYFDYKRRNDLKFRKELKKKQKAAEKKEKEVAKKEEAAPKVDLASKLKALFDSIKAEPIPSSPAKIEEYLLYHLSLGEQLASKGPEYYMECAGHMFRAALICPNPVELILMIKQMLQPEVFEMVSILYGLEIEIQKDAFNAYYKENPKPEMNVKFVESKVQPASDITPTFRYQDLAVTKDFKEGEVIYSEIPFVTILAPSYDGKGYCGYCAKQIKEGEASIKSPHSYLQTEFCSTKCSDEVKLDFIESTLVPSSKVLEVISNYYKKGTIIPAIMARGLNRVFKHHQLNMATMDPRKPEASFVQHVERFTPVQLKDTDKVLNDEISSIREYIGVETKGLEEVINLEYYRSMKAKFIRGTFGFSTIPKDSTTEETVTNDEGITLLSPEPINVFGLYKVSPYLIADESDFNVKATFPEGSHKLSLVATKDLPKGTILRVQAFKPIVKESEVIEENQPSEVPNPADQIESKDASINLGEGNSLEEFEKTLMQGLQEAIKQSQLENEDLASASQPIETSIKEVTVESIEKQVDLSSSQEFEKIEESTTPGFDTPPQPESPQ